MKKICVVIVSMLLIPIATSASVVHTTNSSSVVSSETLAESSQIKALFTIHTLNGPSQQIMGYLPEEKVALFRTGSPDVATLKHLFPSEVRSYLDTGMHKEYQKLKAMKITDFIDRNPEITPFLAKLGINETMSFREAASAIDAQPPLPFTGLNVLCAVSGVGGGIIVPPYIPATPLLFVTGIAFINSVGLLGSQFSIGNYMLFLPFLGISIYFPGQGFFGVFGLSGLFVSVLWA